MLLNKFFITKVQHEHTLLNIISWIYSRSEEQLFRGDFLVASSKQDENCPITFIPSHFPFHILSRTNDARKPIISEISFFTRRPECRNS